MSTDRDLTGVPLGDITLSEFLGGGIVTDACLIAQVMEDDGSISQRAFQSDGFNAFQLIGVLDTYLATLRQMVMVPSLYAAVGGNDEEEDDE